MASPSVADRIAQWITKEKNEIATVKLDLRYRKDMHTSFVEKVCWKILAIIVYKN